MDELQATFPNLLDGGQLTQVSLELPQSTTEKQWQKIGLELGKLESSTMWWIGDWWAFEKHGWGDRKALVESEDWIGPAFQTCVNASNVCRTFKSNRRRLLLPFSHHAEVASLPIDESDRLLDWCEETIKGKSKKPRSIRELRDEVKKVKAYLAQGWTASQLERKAQVEAGQMVLANMTSDEHGVPIDNALITWAEAQDLTIRIDRQTYWGNPYEVDADGTREEVIEWYKEYFAHKRSLHKRKAEFKGKKVVLCWCYPLPCHGDFLLEQLNGD